MDAFPLLECSKIVYRTVFRKGWIRENGGLKWQAFKPYLNDTDGISVFIELSDIDEQADKPYFGVVSIHVGKSRDCSNNDITVDIVQDKTWHANIKGVPYHYKEGGSEDNDLKAQMMDICEALSKKASRLLT
jgi:hypothetical protein